MRFHRLGLATCFFAALLSILLTPSVALAQDPVKVAGDMYKVVFENDLLRILDVKIAPGAKTAMHSHPDLVVVVLEPSTLRWTGADGKSKQSGPEFKRSGVQDMPSESHISENIGKTRAHVTLVEFKKPAPAAGTGRVPSLPAPFKQVADNPHARVFEGTAAPGMTIPQHTHRDHVAVSLTNATVELTDKDGKKETHTFKKDTATFAGPVTHSAVNTGKTWVHLIEIELK